MFRVLGLGIVFAVLAVFGGALVSPIGSARADKPDASKPTRPYGIDKRVPLTTSTVIGSPDPPPPYRVKKAFPKLKLMFPIAVRHQPGSDRLLFVGEDWAYGPAQLLRTKDDPETDQFETLVRYKGVAYDIAFHPNFKSNGYFYVGMNGSRTDKDSDPKYTRVLRYAMDPKPPYTFDPKSEKVIIEWLSDGHNGGAIAFGKDGMLYVTSGDGTSDSDRNIVGQDLTKLTSKVLRIDVDHPDGDQAYSVPMDNPFLDNKEARPETWAYGLRNPWRITVDEKTGDVWVGNNGQDLWETAYRIEKGANYGWSVVEGSHPFYPDRKAGPTPFTKPTVEHHHVESRSLTGGIVYYGERFPELRGAYVYGDYSTGKVWGVRHDGTKVTWQKELANTGLQITCISTDSHGEILIGDHRGESKGAFYTFEATPKDLAPSTFPRTLSASGLFKSVKGHVVEPALIPYSVNAPLWSDGAYKERFIALPSDDSKIDVNTARGWNFPEKTVLVKSFALELEQGNPKSRRWIETRFLTKQGTEWAGYSYLWNEDQTDATLVEAKGTDRDFTIKTTDGGTRKQSWHYPSRAECMVCHSRAANFVLGLSALQMNKVHNYGAVADNQLRTLEHLGVFGANWAEEMKKQLRADLKGEQSDSVPGFAPASYPHLVDPYDVHQDLNLRARSYLHANCAQCHVEAGGGNAQIDLEFTTKLENMRILNVEPVHHKFELADARLVAPGHPERSVLLQRMHQRKAGFMPPLATSIVDAEAVKLMDEWIKQLQASKSGD